MQVYLFGFVPLPYLYVALLLTLYEAYNVIGPSDIGHAAHLGGGLAGVTLALMGAL